MILSGFQEEHQLLDWYEQDTIAALQYIEHHSIGMINRFKKWCQESGSSEDEESAKDFLDEYNEFFTPNKCGIEYKERIVKIRKKNDIGIKRIVYITYINRLFIQMSILVSILN